jgi:hypothetical protein
MGNQLANQLPEPKGYPLAEFHVTGEKIAFHNMLVLMAYGCAAAAAWFFLEQTIEKGMAIGFFTLLLAVFLIRSWSMARRDPRLTLYGNGLLVKGIGLYTWDNLGFQFTGEVITLFLRGPRDFMPQDRKAVGAKTVYYEDDVGAIVVQIVVPMGATNVTPKVFEEKLRAAAVKEVTSPDYKAEHTPWASQNPDATKPAKGNPAVSLLTFAFMGLLFYALAYRGFFPSPEWSMAAKLITAIVLLTYARFGYQSISKAGTRDYRHSKRTQQLMFVFLMLPIMGLFLYMGVHLGLGNLMTRSAGQPDMREVMVIQGRIDDGAHFLKIPELGEGFLREVKATRESYNCAEQLSPMSIEGRKSWFGYSVISTGGVPCQVMTGAL